jgi:hypothetical protein
MKRIIKTLVLATVLALAGAVTTAPAPAQAASYVSCYVAMNGNTWCYRYACSAREEMAGCYEGWVLVRNSWWA